MSKRQSPPIEELRRMLQGITWGTFFTKRVLKINGIKFIGRMGLHLGRPALAVTAEGQFVACRHITLPKSFNAKYLPIMKSGYNLVYINEVWQNMLEEIGYRNNLVIYAEIEDTHTTETAPGRSQLMSWPLSIGRGHDTITGSRS